MNKKSYTDMMVACELGARLTQAQFDELLAFAKAKKVKQPKAEWVSAKGPKVKAKCDPSTVGNDEVCEKDARSNGLCAGHYSRLVYRADEEKAERVRESSRRYAAKVRANKAAAKAALELMELEDALETVAA